MTSGMIYSTEEQPLYSTFIEVAIEVPVEVFLLRVANFFTSEEAYDQLPYQSEVSTSFQRLGKMDVTLFDLHSTSYGTTLAEFEKSCDELLNRQYVDYHLHSGHEYFFAEIEKATC